MGLFSTLFSIPTRLEILGEYIAQYAIAFPDKNTAKGSDAWLQGSVVSSITWLILAKFIYILKNALPDKAELAFLQRWGGIFSFPPQGAAPSQGVNSLEVTGTVGAAVPQFSQLVHADGTLYQVTSLGKIIGGDGTVLVDVAAISKGSATNKNAGDTLNFTPSPPTNVDALTTIIKTFVNGLDTEDVEHYRARLLGHLGDPPEGGALHDYVEWLLRVPGGYTAYVWEHRRGLGTLDLGVLGPGAGADRIIADLTPFQTAIDGERPGGAKDIRVITIATQQQDVQAAVLVDETIYPWDWDDLGAGYTITAASSGASQITVPSILPSVVAGKRLTVDGEEAIVSAVAGGGVLTLAFAAPATWFGSDPTGKTVRASGPLVIPIRNAVLALFNNLGPTRGKYAATSFTPQAVAQALAATSGAAALPTTWVDGVRLGKIDAAIADVPGVVDVDIITPGSSVVPVDALPITTTTQLLVPGKISIWKMA